MKQKIRKSCDALASLGIGIWLLGLWCVVKGALYYTLNFSDVINNPGSEINSPVIFSIFTIFCMIILLILHMYIGASARAEGTRGKRRIAYIVWSVLLAALYIWMLPADLDISNTPNQTISAAVVSMITDATTAVILLITASTSIRVKLLKRKMKQEAA